MFLIRTAFWLSLVILLLPTGEGTSPTQANATASDAIAVVGMTVQDLAQFCARNPETCSTGSDVLRTFGAKAEYGARTVYGYLAEMNGSEAALDELRPSLTATGSDTLTETDRDPNWRGPIDGIETEAGDADL
ncbi:MAG: DUF5330 domain-containing protein [Pseudomonadota bacterium]